MKKPEKTDNLITEGVIWKQILLYFFPLLLSSFFQQLYNTADAMIVGRAAGKEALSAVGGSAGSVVGIFVMFFLGFGGGAAVLTAQYFGAKKEAALRTAVRDSLRISVILGLIGAGICFLFADPILKLMQTPADTFVSSGWYLRIVAAGMVPNALYNMSASILRSIGDVRTPLAVLIFSCLVNIGLDVLFVIRLSMGAAGAALATSLCQLLSALLTFLALKKTMSAIRPGLWTSLPDPLNSLGEMPSLPDPLNGSAETAFSGSHPASQPETASPGNALNAPDHTMTGRILKLGLPLGLSEIMYTFANVVLMSVVNGFGTDTVAAYASFGRIDTIFWMIVGSLGIAVTTFAGQNYGAGRWDRVRQSIRDGAVIMFVILVPVIVFIYACAGILMKLFSGDAAVLEIGTAMMRFLMPFYVFYIPIEILYAALRGMGDSVIPTIITFFGVCVLRSAWGLFAVPLHHTINMVLLGFPVTWIVTSVAFMVYYRWYIAKN